MNAPQKIVKGEKCGDGLQDEHPRGQHGPAAREPDVHTRARTRSSGASPWPSAAALLVGADRSYVRMTRPCIAPCVQLTSRGVRVLKAVVTAALPVSLNIHKSICLPCEYLNPDPDPDADPDPDPASQPIIVDPQYLLNLPSDPGIMLPGLWMLFVIDAAGVPSVSKDVRIKPVARPASPTPAAATPAAAPAPATAPAVGSAAALQPATSAGG